MEVVYKKVVDLKPYENNPRIITDEAIDKVASSIKEFGFKVPILLDKDSIIIAGHTRYKACLKLNIDKVPCIYADDLTDEQVKAFRLADNKTNEFSSWDFELLDIELEDIGIDMSEFGFDDEEIDWADVPDLDEDSYTEPEHEKLECPKCHHIDRKIHFKKV